MIRQYLFEHRDTKFSWGNNNCLAFVSGYLEKCGLDGFPSEWTTGYKNTTSAIRVYRKNLEDFGYESIVEALDDLFYRELTLHPQDGYIVARQTNDVMGYAIGLVCADGCYFLGPEGLVVTEPQATDFYWSTNC